MDQISGRRVLAGLIECGLIRPGGGRSFAGVVMFNMHELAEWVGNWVLRPVTVTDIACATVAGRACGSWRRESRSARGLCTARPFDRRRRRSLRWGS